MQIVENYCFIKNIIIAAGYKDEITWQENIKLDDISESDFLRESAWVVLSSGMRESVVRNKFRDLSRIFYNWESANKIVIHSFACKLEALTVFNHQPKVDAIVSIASIVDSYGFSRYKSLIQEDSMENLMMLPFIGPATAFHLAKNIGIDVVKPDRHLVRYAQASGYETPRDMCAAISDITGDRLSVVDLVLWRFATIYPEYLKVFRTEC